MYQASSQPGSAPYSAHQSPSNQAAKPHLAQPSIHLSTEEAGYPHLEVLHHWWTESVLNHYEQWLQKCISTESEPNHYEQWLQKWTGTESEVNQYHIRSKSVLNQKWTSTESEANQYRIRSESVPNQKQISTESEVNQYPNQKQIRTESWCQYQIRTESLQLWSTTSSRIQRSFLCKLVPVVCVYPEVNDGSSFWNWQRTRPWLDRWQRHNGTLLDFGRNKWKFCFMGH